LSNDKQNVWSERSPWQHWRKQSSQPEGQQSSPCCWLDLLGVCSDAHGNSFEQQVSLAGGLSATGDALRGIEAKSMVTMLRRAQMCRNVGDIGSCWMIWWIVFYSISIAQIADRCQGGRYSVRAHLTPTTI